MEMKNLGDEKSPVLVACIEIVLPGGEREEIIPVFNPLVRRFSPPKKDEEFLKQVNPDKLLHSVFNFCDVKPFVDAGIELSDFTGKVIPKEMPKGSLRPLVYLDDAVTFWQFHVREEIHAVIKDFKTAKEALEAVGLTDLFSRPLNNVEALGVDAAVTGNKAVEDTWRFANEFKTPMNTAKLYLQIAEHTSRISKIRAAGFKVEKEPVQGRTYEEASLLFKGVASACRNVKIAMAKYVISVLNSYSGLFTTDEILEVLKQVSFEDGEAIRLAGCDDKEVCIRGVLDPHFRAMQDVKQNGKEVA